MNSILLFFLWLVASIALRLRYRISVKGLDEVYRLYGNRGVLFLPNHPALIDPVILSSVLWLRFHPRALVVEKQIRASALKYFWKRLRILPLPEMGVTGLAGYEAVLAQITGCIEALRSGDNLLMYPAGRIYRSKMEKLRANGGAARILQEEPQTKVVLVRTTGLWGSDFGRGKGYQLTFGQTLARHWKDVLLGGIFFMPRRHVSIEFVPRPADMPDGHDKERLNRYLEDFYNVAMRPNTYVPYTWFEGGSTRTVPEPDTYNAVEDTSRVPADVRQKVRHKLIELSDKKMIRETDTLGTDLGLDSLVVAELHQWLQNEFGHDVPSPEKLRTVASVLIAAIGESAGVEPLKPIPTTWYYHDSAPLEVTMARTVPEAFLINAKRHPNRPVWADQAVGVFTNRKMVLAVMALSPAIRKLEGDRIGIIMPATVISTVLYLACQFAGKIPVMINWTVGNRNMRHCIANAQVRHILTAAVLIERLKGTGVDFSGIEELFVPLETLRNRMPLWRKLYALLMSRLCWRALWKAPIPDTAAILFTSGSESLPKTVPMRHESILADLRDSVKGMGIRQDDCLLGMLPPFHSFGLLLNTLFTCASNIRVVYHPNPTEGAMLARITAAYKVSFFCGTPTFIANILRNGNGDQFELLKLVVTGAEKCPASTLELMHRKAPNASLYEGYGITECGPIVSLNKPGFTKFGTIGRLMDCSEGVVVDEAVTRSLPPGATGMLLVRGTNIFPGYINYDGPSPFVKFAGKEWYRTGDLVKMDSEGFITFMGRLKRFVKIGGEMVSLPAIEEALAAAYPNPDQQAKGPALAVEASGDDANPVITLFTVLDLDRETVNQTLRNAGFSPIHSIREIRKVTAIPLLGTGKTDYRALRSA